MESDKEIKRAFQKLIAVSMSPRQIEDIAQQVDSRFDLYRECGMSRNIPIPRQIAAEAVINFFKRENDIIELFITMLKHENKKLRENILVIQNKNEFINMLKKHKWIYDEYMNRFNRDPFYEKEIDFLKSIRTIDLRREIPQERIISEIKKTAKEFCSSNLNWKITIRLYELNNSNENVIKNIIELLLTSQNLEKHTNDILFCLKEFASNASKANFKVAFEKNIAAQQGLDPDKNYKEFINAFNNEFKSSSDTLYTLVKEDDIFFNIFLQSSVDSIALWVSNYTHISEIEKKRIYKKMKMSASEIIELYDKTDHYAEGAGMGVHMVQEVLKNLSCSEDPIKLFFYPDFFKIGFILKRSELKV